MINFDVQIYKDTVQPMLKRLRREMPTIDQVVRGAIATTIVGYIQKEKLRGQVLGRITGDLAASIDWRHLSDSDTAVGSYGVIYARIHEKGGEIRPVHKKWLRFQVDGHWVTTKLVRMPKRPYLLPGITETFDSGEAMNVAERVLQTQLARLESA